jgi:hypothetical protein
MAVIALDIMAGDDPNGSALATLTDADVETFEMRCAENELGSGQFTIRRDHASATAANLAGGNYVKVTIPIIDTDPIFGFWLDEQDDTVLSESEEGGEFLTRGGPGALAVLGRALLLNQFYNGSLGGEDRGNVTIPGFWTWTAEPYGAILVRLIEEGQLEPGLPLTDVTIDFNRTHGTDGVDWPNIIETIQFDIGVDGLEVYQRLIESGHLFVVADPDLKIHGYGSRPSVSRASATFASGKVRFLKGTNIETELVRQAQGTKAYTHALVKGKDLVYRQVVSPDFSSGDQARWKSVDYPESNDTDLLDKVGAHALALSKRLQDQIEFETLPGDDESVGLYLPFKHYNVGDVVRVHTGSAAWDYNESNEPVAGIRISLGEVSDDQTDDLAAKSLHVVVELNGGPTSDGAGRPTDVTQGGCAPCPGDFPWVPNTPGSFYAGEFPIVGDTNWVANSDLSDAADLPGGAQSSAPTTVNLVADQTYDYVVDLEMLFGSASSGRISLINDDLTSAFSVPLEFLNSSGSGPDFHNDAGTYHFTGSFTAPDVGHLKNPYRMRGQTAQFPHGHDVKGHCQFVINPPGWPTTGTPPSVGQQYPPTRSSMVPDGDETSDTTPTAYAPGSLHVEMNGSRLAGGGVDFTETSPTTGGYTFTRPPLTDAEIVYWYQVGTP